MRIAATIVRLSQSSVDDWHTCDEACILPHVTQTVKQASTTKLLCRTILKTAAERPACLRFILTSSPSHSALTHPLLPRRCCDGIRQPSRAVRCAATLAGLQQPNPGQHRPSDQLQPRRSRPATETLHEARQGQLGHHRARRVPLAAAGLDQSLGDAHDRHFRRGRRRRRRLPGVRVRAQRLQQQGQQGGEAALRLQGVRHRPRRLHQQRRAVYRAEDDGGEQPEGHAAAADRR